MTEENHDPETAETIDIPEVKSDAFPVEKAKISEYDRPNWARNHETVNKFLARANMFYDKFRGQGPRDSFEDWMDKADELTRVAADITKQDHNKTPDSTDTRPDIFYRIMRTITANDNDVLFAGSSLRVQYEPLPDVEDMLWQAAKVDAEKQNAVLEYSCEQDQRVSRMREAIWGLYKYANKVVGMHWRVNEFDIRERVPVKDPETGAIVRDGKGRPQMKWETKKQRTAHPVFEHYDMADFYFDANIDDFEQQQCIIRKMPLLLAEMVEMQRTGQFQNVQFVGKDQLYTGESPSTVRGARQTAAGDGASTEEATGYFKGWEIWMRAPINDEGEWDEENTLAEWHRLIFVGNIEGEMTRPRKNGRTKLTGPVALQLCKNFYYRYPFCHGVLPYKLIHSHWDDKGAFHMGFVNVLEPAWQEYKTTLDQWFYNKNLSNNAPWLMEKGALVSEDKVFGPRKLLVAYPGKMDRIKRLDVLSNTNDMLAFIQYLERYMNESAGTTKPYRGEGLGGRASAQEARNAMEQSLKPAAERLSYVEEQLIAWVAQKDAAYWRQFAEPDQVIAILRDDQIAEVRPAELHGNVRIRLIGVSQFITDAMERMEEERLLATTLPIAAPIMGKDGIRACMRHVYRKRGFPVGEMFPPVQDFDAVHVARSENVAMITTGQFDQPQREENQTVHIAEHTYGEAIYSTDPSVPKERLALIVQHRLIHEQFQKEAMSMPIPGAGGPQPAEGPVPGQQEGPPPGAGAGNEAAMMGEMMAAEGGGMGPT